MKRPDAWHHGHKNSLSCRCQALLRCNLPTKHLIRTTVSNFNSVDFSQVSSEMHVMVMSLDPISLIKRDSEDKWFTSYIEMTCWLQHASEQHSICVDRHSLFNYLLLLQHTPIFALMQTLLLCIGLAQTLSRNVSHLIFHPGKPSESRISVLAFVCACCDSGIPNKNLEIRIRLKLNLRSS